jgi:uncharacterized protein YndB with AHSA1/START domain
MTQTQQPPTSVALVLRRTFDAPRETVFKAWTQPAILQQFMGGRGCKRVDVDLRTGGAYRMTMVGPDGPEGEDFVAKGIYREVSIPERVVCTWTWEEDDPADEHETLLTLEFLAKGNQTELVLTHENFKDAAQCERHTAGWNSVLDNYGKLIS